MSTEIVKVPDLTYVMATDLKNRGVNHLTMGTEGVICPYGDPTIDPWFMMQLNSLKYQIPGLRVALLTNTPNEPLPDDQRGTGFVDRVANDLDWVVALHPGLPNVPRKPRAGMFSLALEISGRRPEESAHVDNRFRAFLGARAVGYNTFYWTEPYGEHLPAGAWLTRNLLGRPIVSPALHLRDAMRHKRQR